MKIYAFPKAKPPTARTGEGFYQPMTNQESKMIKQNYTPISDEYISVCNGLQDEFHGLVDLVRMELNDKASILVYVSAIQSLKEHLRNLGVSS